jgi:hypothetical protein
MLTNDPGNVGVLGHQPKRVKAFSFDSTKRLVRAKPPKPSKKRFLSRISLGRCDQASKALGYLFSLRHASLSLASSSPIASKKYHPSCACWTCQTFGGGFVLSDKVKAFWGPLVAERLTEVELTTMLSRLLVAGSSRAAGHKADVPKASPDAHFRG